MPNLGISIWRSQLVPEVVPPPVSGIFAADTFTDTAGVLLQNHTPSGGGTWAKHGDSTCDIVITDANRVRSGGTSGQLGLYYHSGTPSAADYTVSADLRLVTDSNASQIAVAARIDVTTGACYWFGLSTFSNGWRLFYYDGTTHTQVGTTVAQGMTGGQDFAIDLTVTGTTLTCFLGGVAIITQTDANLTAAGKAGIIALEPAANSTGVHLDNFEATT